MNGTNQFHVYRRHCSDVKLHSDNMQFLFVFMKPAQIFYSNMILPDAN